MKQLGNFSTGRGWRKYLSLNKLVALTSVCFVLTIFVRNSGRKGGGKFAVNNFGDNVGLVVDESRFRDVPDNNVKKILFWNDAYGSRRYDIGFGREIFYENLCPETRCFTTSNRTYLKSVADFDAVVIHQRGIEWDDMPQQRRSHQRYVHWVVESAQYLYTDIHNLDGYFNWTMTYRRDSDFYLPYGRVVQTKPHPMPGEELQQLIRKFGEENAHRFGHNRSNKAKAAWFVSHCATQARREKYAKAMQKHMDIDVYGKCSKSYHPKAQRHNCSRDNEADCYEMLESSHRFYLSFENSLCEDYVTEKFFNILKYDIVPVVFNGAHAATYAPPHSAVNVFDYPTPEKLVRYLDELARDDALYASYFWWRDYYEVRNRAEDRAQAYCDLCRRLNDPDEPANVYEDMFDWWVSQSQCKKFSPPR